MIKQIGEPFGMLYSCHRSYPVPEVVIGYYVLLVFIAYQGTTQRLMLLGRLPDL